MGGVGDEVLLHGERLLKPTTEADRLPARPIREATRIDAFAVLRENVMHALRAGLSYRHVLHRGSRIEFACASALAGGPPRNRPSTGTGSERHLGSQVSSDWSTPWWRPNWAAPPGPGNDNKLGHTFWQAMDASAISAKA
jgi:hypothetical protein